MPKPQNPRHGSMQYWPRKRARRAYARVRSWPLSNEPKMLGFAGYKACMAHVILTDNKKTSMTKGQDIAVPATIIECPPLKAFSVRFYKNKTYGLSISTEVLHEKLDKDLSRKIAMPKKTKKIDDVKPEDYDAIRLVVYTQPRLTGIGKKKPEVFEISLGGKKEQQLEYAKSVLGKDIRVSDIFKSGQLIDVHAVTKGKGYQGPVKRFGVKIRSHKAEKTKRGPGSLGPWTSQGHIMYRVAHAGKMGYHMRTEHNKAIIKISDDPKDVSPAGGIKHYGTIKNDYLVVKGSVIGPSKRVIRFNHPMRENKKLVGEAPVVKEVII